MNYVVDLVVYKPSLLNLGLHQYYFNLNCQLVHRLSYYSTTWIIINNDVYDFVIKEHH